MVAQTTMFKQATIDFFQVLVHVISSRGSHLALEDTWSIAQWLKVMVKALEIFLPVFIRIMLCSKRNIRLCEGLLRRRQGAAESQER